MDAELALSWRSRGVPQKIAEVVPTDGADGTSCRYNASAFRLAPPRTKLSPLLFVEGACLRRICMTAVRRLMLLTCAVAVLPLSGQTSQGTKTTVSVPPAPAAPAATGQVSQDERATPPVTAETDGDANNPRALRLSLHSAGKTPLT